MHSSIVVFFLFLSGVYCGRSKNYGSVMKSSTPQPTPQPMPEPYTYSYNAVVGTGKPTGIIAADESGDASGIVTGEYSLMDPDGRVRIVSYTADGNGFRATVKTNEPGTSNKNPADVVMIPLLTSTQGSTTNGKRPSIYGSVSKKNKPKMSKYAN